MKGLYLIKTTKRKFFQIIVLIIDSLNKKKFKDQNHIILYTEAIKMKIPIIKKKSKINNFRANINVQKNEIKINLVGPKNQSMNKNINITKKKQKPNSGYNAFKNI